MSDFSNSGTADIDQVLAQNAFVIGDQIYANTLNTSRWYAVIPKAPLPIGMGDNLTSLIYDKSIPTTSTSDLTAIGVTWSRVGTEITSAQQLNTSVQDQPNHYAANETIGSTAGQSYIRWSKKLRSYFLETARIKSPYVDINDIRSAASLAKQTSAIMEALTDATKWTWERRYQESYERLCANVVPCLTSSTPILDTVDASAGDVAEDPFFGVNLTALDFRYSGASNADVTPTATLSNKILDRIKTRLDLMTSANDAYGMDNGKPVYCLMIGDDASYALKTESGIRDDVRKSSRVDTLLKPLGVDESFRGFYHMCLPDPPRFTMASGVLTRVEPRTALGAYNSAYDSAPYEAAYVVHKGVMEAQVPPPNVAAPGFKFDPVNYAGEFNWLNIQDEIKNPLKTIGFFLGTFACANLPKKVEHGYTIIFKRDAAAAA